MFPSVGHGDVFFSDLMAIDRGEENLNNADQDVECTTNETIDVSDISSGVSGIDELDVEVSEWHENTQPDETEECSRMDCDDEVGKGEGDLTLGKASSCGGAKRASEKEPMQVVMLKFHRIYLNRAIFITGIVTAGLEL